MPKLGVIIGRFNPVHRAHLEHLILPALAKYDHVLLLLGSSLKARDHKNPLRWQVRAQLIRELVSNDQRHQITFRPIRDFAYVDDEWTLQVQRLVASELEKLDGEWSVTLVGNDKDASSFYLRLFPQWGAPDINKVENFKSATDIRDAMFTGKWDLVEELCFPETVERLRTWLQTPEGQYVQADYDWHQRNSQVIAIERKDLVLPDREQMVARLRELAEDLASFEENPLSLQAILLKEFSPLLPTPYKPIFHTTDNVVLWRGNVLLIKRRSHPGKGLWALPGGYLNPDEWIVDGALREGEEETRVRIYPPGSRINDPHLGKPIGLSRAWQTRHECFDDPNRSRRGRIITDAFLWQIPDEFEVDTRAGDDAAQAKFFPLHAILNGPMDYDLFEDHQEIIRTLVLKR